MEALQRLQPLDVLLVAVWVALVAWGLSSGLIRQISMLVAVYAAAVAANYAYRQGGQVVSLVVGREALPQLEFWAYVVEFVVVFAVIGILIWFGYPLSRLNRGFGFDNVVGAIVGGAWGALLLIAIVTILRFYLTIPWRGQEITQQSVSRQVRDSQVAPVLEVVFWPLWQSMRPWFPGGVGPSLSS